MEGSVAPCREYYVLGSVRNFGVHAGEWERVQWTGSVPLLADILERSEKLPPGKTSAPSLRTETSD